MNLATVLLGPLVVPECRRSVGRGWLILVRALAALMAAGMVLTVLWLWWFNRQLDAAYSPFGVLRGGLMALEGMGVTVALVLGPAVLAGSLAGEKQRGTLGLLLTTAVSAREIVAGRLVGKLSQVAMILLTGLPAVVLLAVLAGFRPPVLALLLALPAAVAFGGGGIAVAASALARRGRDALLVVYLLILLALLGPLLGGSLGPEVAGWLGPLNPFSVLEDLVRHEGLTPGLWAVGLWGAMGLLGTGVASWRLRPSCLRQLGGEARHRGRLWRGLVPPVGEDPMLWKELFIERAGTLGRFGNVLGAIVILLLAGTSTLLAVLIAWQLWVRGDATAADSSTGLLDLWVGRSAPAFGWLIQWAIGLRAAVAIATERERGTWDALLTSPLDGTEIVRGKLWGSLYALRGLLAATWWAWTLALACGVMSGWDYASHVAGTLVIGAFMAAVGVRTSLATATATRAMAVTIGLWMGAAAAIRVASLIVTCILFLIGLVGWMTAASLGLVSWSARPWGPWIPMLFFAANTVIALALYVLATALIVSEARLRFDRVAGRMAGGKVAVAVDELLHGRPMAPVRPEDLGRPQPKAKPAPDYEGFEVVEDLGPR
jgi:ABC-type Na+ efflux pump permease subunit